MVDILRQDHLGQGRGRPANPVWAAGRLAVPERRDPAASEQAAPFAHGADVHAQAGGDLGRALARQRQQDRSGTIRLAAPGRSCQRPQGRASLLIGRDLRALPKTLTP
jgi:hypothetical protein